MATPKISADALAKMSTNQLVDAFKIDSIKVDEEIDTTAARGFVAVLLLIVAAWLGFILGAWFGGVIRAPATPKLLLSFSGMICFLAPVLWSVLVSVPEVTGLITINVFTGRLHSWSTGLHFKFPWDQVKWMNYINLRLRARLVTITVPAKDGPTVTYPVNVPYRGSLKRLPLYQRAPSTEIDNQIDAIVGSVFSGKILDSDSETLRSEEKRQELEYSLTDAFGQSGDGNGHEAEYRYGIEFEPLSLREPQLDQDYLEALNTEAIALRVKTAADRIMTIKGSDGATVSAESAINSVMIMNKDKVTRNVTALEGAGFSNALSAGFKAISDAIKQIKVVQSGNTK